MNWRQLRLTITLPTPQLQHRQSGAHARLSAPLSIDRGGVRTVSWLIEKEIVQVERKAV